MDKKYFKVIDHRINDIIWLYYGYYQDIQDRVEAIGWSCDIIEISKEEHGRLTEKIMKNNKEFVFQM
jgi:hypothetical protein